MSEILQNKPLIVGYWNIRGLGAPLRMLVMYANVPLQVAAYDCIEKSGGGYDASEWFSDKSELKLKNPLINLPYVIDGDLVISQSNACLSYLGKKLGLWGTTPQQEVRCEELLSEIMDLRNKIREFSYASDGSLDKAERLLQDICGKNGIFQKLELCFEHEVHHGHKGTFLVGGKATAPDFHLWEMLDQYTGLASSYSLPLWEGNHFTRLHTFYREFRALPQNQRYFSSKLATLPFNNKMAAFGATQSRERWIPGMEYDWANVNGIY